MKFAKISGSMVFIALFLWGCQTTDPVAPLSSEAATSTVSLLSKPADGRGELKVMDWNIYIGANVDIVLSAENELDLLMKVAAAYDTLGMTNFPERAQTIAGQVAKFKPHVIALQEVSLIQRFDDLDNPHLLDQQDYLNILLNALAEQGQSYQLADLVYNADVTVPRLAGFNNASEMIIDYVRVLDADVILVRTDVAFSDVVKGHYETNLPPIPGVGILPRGYVSINADINGRHYRIVNTHLEAFGGDIRYAQAQELASVFAGETLPVVMMGDFNTDDLTPPNPYMDDTYRFMTETAGYYDAWDYNLYGHQSDGNTYGNASDLMNPDVNLYERIDFVFVGNTGPGAGHNPIGPVYAEVIGDEQKDRTVSGLWPSDHAGIIARLHISAPQTVAAN